MLRAFLIGLVLLLSGEIAWAQPATPSAGQSCINIAVAGGTADALTVPSLPCMPTSALLILTTPLANQTSAPTISQNGGAGQAILSNSGGPLSPGTLLAGARQLLSYNGQNWFLLNSLGASLTGFTATNNSLKGLNASGAIPTWRLGFTVSGDSPPLLYQPSAFACSLSGGLGDNGSQVKSADGRCWLADFPENDIDVRQFGADPTGSADAATQLQACLNSLGASGGSCRIDRSSKIRILTSVTVPAGAGIKCGNNGRVGNPGVDWTTSPYANLGSIKIASTATITYSSMFSLQGCLVYRDGMTFPAADASAYAGTPFSAVGGGANDVTFRDDLILGFATSLNHGGGDRLTLDGFYADGVNCAVIGSSFDTSSIRHSHCYPWGTVATSGGTCPGSVCTRTGTAWTFSGESDDTDLDDVLAFGYATGFTFGSNGNVRLGKIWADNCATVCVDFTGTIDRVAADDIRSYAGAIGVRFGANVGRIQIANINVTNTTSGSCAEVDGGVLQIANLTVDTCKSWGLLVNSTTPKVGIAHMDAQVWGGSGAACPIGIVAGVTTDNLMVSMFTHDASVTCQIGANQLSMPSVALAANNIPLTVSTSEGYVITNASGTATTMSGAIGGRKVTLTFNSAGLIITQAGSCTGSGFRNTSGANITTSAGGTYSYIWDGQNGGCWKQL